MKSKLLAVTPGPLWTGSCLNLCLHWSCSGHSGCLQCLWLSALKSFRCRVSTFSVREVPFTLLCLAPSHYLSFTSNGPSSMLPSLTTEYVIWHSPRFILCGRLCIIFFRFPTDNSCSFFEGSTQYIHVLWYVNITLYYCIFTCVSWSQQK